MLLLTASAQGVSPAGDEAHGASRSTAGGQGHGLHVAGQSGRFAQLDQHNVIIQSRAAVIRVSDDLLRADELLSALIDCDVVLAKVHLNAAGMTVILWLFTITIHLLTQLIALQVIR